MIPVANKKQWEIWWAYVKYEDKPNRSKKRPVLVIYPMDDCIACLKITSQGRKNPEDFLIPDWEKCGLKKESTICINSGIREIAPKDFMEKVGKLSPADIYVVQQRLSQRKAR